MTKVWFGLLGSAFVLGSSAIAQAAPAPVFADDFGNLFYTANVGQINIVTVSSLADRVIVTDLAGLAAGSSCKQINFTTVNCVRPLHNFKVDLQDGNDTLTNFSDITVVANGGPGNDTFIGSSAPEAFIGDDGDDTMYGNGGGDDLVGGAGNDTIFAGDGDDLILDFSGNDFISGGAGNDQINDYGGIDIINGDSGNDTITAFDEAFDTVNCGLGTDTFGGDAQDIRISCENKYGN